MSTSSDVWLRIIAVNDVYELDNFASLKTLIQENSNDDDPDALLITLAGDFLAPSLLSSLDKGRSMVDVLNACGFTHVCFGNHECDVGKEALKQNFENSSFTWINTNMQELNDKLDMKTPSSVIVEVKHHGESIKRVGLLGLLTNDPALYRPDSFDGSTIEPVVECTERYLRQHSVEDSIDLWIPLTHQSMADDRIFANKFGGTTFPIILGGHDHWVYDETHNQARIIKTGHDCENAAVVDIRWNQETNVPTIDVQMIPTAKYPPNAEMEERVQGHKRILQELQRAKLFRFQDWVDNDDDAFSTTNNRIWPSNGSTALVSMLRMGMRCQCGLMNAGSIRGNEVYKDQEWFTWSDLKAEIPYPTEMVASYIPGRVLQETIAYSRRGARETPVVARGGYIQVCSNIKFNDETLKIESIAGEPLDLDALYLTTLPAKFFMGIDNHVPLLEWATGRCEENVTEECGRPAKVVIVELFSAILWLNMGSFDEIDTNSDGKLSRDEVKQRVVEIYGEQIADLVVDNIMSVADIDHSGYISPLEMMVVQFVATDMLNHVCTREELSVMRKVASEVLGQRPSHADMKRVIQELHRELDITKNGKVQRSEAMKALGSIRRRSLLE